MTKNPFTPLALLLAVIIGSLPANAQNKNDQNQLELINRALAGGEGADQLAMQLAVQLAAAKQSYGPDHPKVRALEAELKTRRDTEKQVHETHIRLLEEQLHMQIAELDARRRELDAVSRNIKETETHIVMSPEALKLMAQRIGEAQIESRLRELESKAIIEALTASLKDVKRSAKEQMEIDLAEQLLQTQRAQLERVSALAERQMVSAAEVAEAKMNVQMAESRLRAGIAEPDGRTKLNAKISEAATQRAVSIAMQKLLIAEAQKINELLKKSAASEEVRTESALVRDQMNRLKQQLMEVEIQAALQSKELTRMNLLLREVDKAEAEKSKQKVEPSKRR